MHLDFGISKEEATLPTAGRRGAISKYVGIVDEFLLSGKEVARIELNGESAHRHYQAVLLHIKRRKAPIIPATRGGNLYFLRADSSKEE